MHMKWLLILTVSVILLAGCAKVDVSELTPTTPIPIPKIAYTTTSGSIYIMNTDGSNQRTVTTDEYLKNTVCWSKDNKRLAHLSLGDSQPTLVIVNIEDSEKTTVDLKIIPEISQKKSYYLGLMSRCWRPSSDRILLSMVALGINEPDKIYEIDPKNRVATLVMTDGFAPVLSPSGDRFVFIRDWSSQILEVGDNTILSEDLTENFCVDWSPNGDKLVCIGSEEYQSIFTINTDGTEKTEIPNVSLREGDRIEMASWSPDGEKILFSVFSSSDECFMYTVNIDGTGQLRLLNSTDACVGIYSNP
ncbi:hypothetical protein FIM05_01500 [SAR202 cluster bacterium AD-802-K11_MRT_200m]|nr:hypothetical protein [SAR202 cluster bacterium AD-802-K11_MRT_200m]